jgi:hypothetical protein
MQLDEAKYEGDQAACDDSVVLVNDMGSDRSQVSFCDGHGHSGHILKAWHRDVGTRTALPISHDPQQRHAISHHFVLYIAHEAGDGVQQDLHES